MNRINLTSLAIAVYLLLAVVTFGHAHAYLTRTASCGEKTWCVSPGERAFYSSAAWPFYWSMTAWRDEP